MVPTLSDYVTYVEMLERVDEVDRVDFGAVNELWTTHFFPVMQRCNPHDFARMRHHWRARLTREAREAQCVDIVGRVVTLPELAAHVRARPAVIAREDAICTFIALALHLRIELHDPR